MDRTTEMDIGDKTHIDNLENINGESNERFKRPGYSFLTVDDEKPITKMIANMLSIYDKNSIIYSTNSPLEALEIYKSKRIDIVLTDILMPEMMGIDFIKAIKKIDNDVQVIVASGISDMSLIREAMRQGAYDYILKPFSLDDFKHSISRITERIELLKAKKEYVQMLEDRVNQTTRDLSQTFVSSLGTLIYALEARDRYTHQHSTNVSKYASEIAQLLNLDKDTIDDIHTGGTLHDVGKIGIPDSILLKPSGLTDYEFETVKTHPWVGRKIVYPVMRSKPNIIDFVEFHHERFDGRGYPRGLKGEEIPLVARIANIADSFDTMISSRVYKTRMTLEQAADELKRCKGTQFDPEIAQLFINSL